jgi:hypothetical protein
MLQKLPKSVGDSITLGSLICIGIAPTSNSSFVPFASFERDGELISYEIKNQALIDQLSHTLTDMLMSDMKDIDVRTDYKYVVKAGYIELLYNNNTIEIQNEN